MKYELEGELNFSYLLEERLDFFRMCKGGIIIVFRVADQVFQPPPVLNGCSPSIHL